MPLPDPTRTYETFLTLRLPWELGHQCVWWAYQHRLRTAVSPLIRKLQEAGVIGWFGFLIHDYHSGVPTLPTDRDAYLHLRMTLSPDATPEDLQSHLPATWRWTRPMEFPETAYLDRVEVSTLRDGDVRLGWQLLGAHSEWVLTFIEAHDPDSDIPHLNAMQLVHYLDNMLLLDFMRQRPPAPQAPRKKKSGKGKKAKKNAKQKIKP